MIRKKCQKIYKHTLLHFLIKFWHGSTKMVYLQDIHEEGTCLRNAIFLATMLRLVSKLAFIEVKRMTIKYNVSEEGSKAIRKP